MEEGKEVKRGQSEGSVARRENYGREGGRLRLEWCASCKKKRKHRRGVGCHEEAWDTCEGDYDFRKA